MTKRLLFFGTPNLGWCVFWVYWHFHVPRYCATTAVDRTHTQKWREYTNYIDSIGETSIDHGCFRQTFKLVGIGPAMRYIEPSWITSVWTFVDHLKAKLHIKYLWSYNHPKAKYQLIPLQNFVPTWLFQSLANLPIVDTPLLLTSCLLTVLPGLLALFLLYYLFPVPQQSCPSWLLPY